MTDRYPVDVYYVEHLDQVWIVNWRDEEDHGVKTIQVIREASQKKKHHTVHPEPIDGHFDLVHSLFVPTSNVNRFRVCLLVVSLFDGCCLFLFWCTTGVRPPFQIRLRFAYQSTGSVQTESAGHEIRQSYRFGAIQLRAQNGAVFISAWVYLHIRITCVVWTAREVTVDSIAWLRHETQMVWSSWNAKSRSPADRRVKSSWTTWRTRWSTIKSPCWDSPTSRPTAGRWWRYIAKGLALPSTSNEPPVILTLVYYFYWVTDGTDRVCVIRWPQWRSRPISHVRPGRVVIDAHKYTHARQAGILYWSKRCPFIFYGPSLFFASNAEQGLKFAFDVRTTLNVSDVIFHPSTTTHSYDLYATSADKGDVLFLNLETGTREKNQMERDFGLLGEREGEN